MRTTWAALPLLLAMALGARFVESEATSARPAPDGRSGFEPGERILAIDTLSSALGEENVAILTNRQLVVYDPLTGSAASALPLDRIRSIRVQHHRGFLDETLLSITLEGGRVQSFVMTRARVDDDAPLDAPGGSARLVERLRDLMARTAIPFEETPSSTAGVD